jgi:predicted DNA-binding protein
MRKYRKKKEKQRLTFIATVRMTDQMINQLNQHAEEKGKTYGYIIRQAIEEYFARHDEDIF